MIAFPPGFATSGRVLIETCTRRSDGLGELEELWDENHRNRLFLQRALMALPRPQSRRSRHEGTRIRDSRNSRRTWLDFDIRASLLQHARRLLDDLDTNRASIFLKMAEGMGK